MVKKFSQHFRIKYTSIHIIILKNSVQFFALHKNTYLSEDNTSIRAKQKCPFYSIQKVDLHLKASLTSQLFMEGFPLPPIKGLPELISCSWLIFLPLHLTQLSFLCTPLIQNPESTLLNQLPKGYELICLKTTLQHLKVKR